MIFIQSKNALAQQHVWIVLGAIGIPEAVAQAVAKALTQVVAYELAKDIIQAIDIGQAIAMFRITQYHTSTALQAAQD